MKNSFRFLPESFLFRSKSEEIDDEDVWYYHTERCAEAGEEYNPELKWLKLESESEIDNDQSLGGGSGVLEGSSGEYFAPTGISDGWPINIEFVRPARGGYAPDVRRHNRDVESGLVGPGVTGIQGFQEERVGEGSGKDRHS